MKLNKPSLFRQQCHIDGNWVDASNGKTIDVTNPADHSVLGTVPSLTTEDVRQDIEDANRALTAWRDMAAKQRSQLSRRRYDLCMTPQEDLDKLLRSEERSVGTEGVSKDKK